MTRTSAPFTAYNQSCIEQANYDQTREIVRVERLEVGGSLQTCKISCIIVHYMLGTQWTLAFAFHSSKSLQSRRCRRSCHRRYDITGVVRQLNASKLVFGDASNFMSSGGRTIVLESLEEAT